MKPSDRILEIRDECVKNIFNKGVDLQATNAVPLIAAMEMLKAVIIYLDEQQEKDNDR